MVREVHSLPLLYPHSPSWWNHFNISCLILLCLSLRKKKSLPFSYTKIFICICLHVCLLSLSLVAQMVKHLLTRWETWVQSLGQDDPLEKEMATHSSTLAWKIPWTEEPGRLQSMGLQRVRHDWATPLSLSHLWPRMWSILEKVLWALEKKVKFIVLGWNVL